MARSGRNSNRYGADGYELTLDPTYETEIKKKYKPICIECARPMSYDVGQDGICNRCTGLEMEAEYELR